MIYGICDVKWRKKRLSFAFIALINIYERDDDHITACTHVGSIQWVRIRFLTNGHFDHINYIFMKLHYKNERKREKKETIRIKTNCSYTIIKYFEDIINFSSFVNGSSFAFTIILSFTSWGSRFIPNILHLLSWNRNDVISINVSIISSADEPKLMWFRYDGAHICRGGCVWIER